MVAVVGGGEPRHHAPRRIESCGRLERTGQGPRGRDAIEPERPVLADLGVRARDVPAARVGDDPIGVQRAFAAPALAVGVSDRDRTTMAYRVGDGEQDLGVRAGELRRARP